jgi:hypothetical protein
VLPAPGGCERRLRLCRQRDEEGKWKEQLHAAGSRRPKAAGTWKSGEAVPVGLQAE